MPTTSQPSTMTMVLIRVFWMALGPLILGLLLMAIARTDQGWFTPADLWFLAILTALIFARWAEIRTGNALNTMGEPAKPDDFRKYVAGVTTLGLVGWVIANVIGNYLSPH